MLKSLVPLANFSFWVTSIPSSFAIATAPCVSDAGNGSSRYANAIFRAPSAWIARTPFWPSSVPAICVAETIDLYPCA